MSTLESLRELLDHAYAHTSERDLQDKLEQRLKDADVPYRREHHLGQHGRPDFVVGREAPYIAIEVKVAGSRSDLLRQVQGYLLHDDVTSCLVVSTRYTHLNTPNRINGKPVGVLWLSAAGAFGDVTVHRPAPPKLGRMWFEGNQWHIQAKPHAMIRIRRMFPRVSYTRRNPETDGVVSVDTRGETCRDLVWLLDRYSLNISERDMAKLQSNADEYDERMAVISALATGKIEARSFEMALPPRGYQATGAEMVLQTRGLLVTDQLGLGKTILGIAMLSEADTRPAIVVTQTHLARQWQRELKRFAPELKTHIAKKGTPYDIARQPRQPKVKGDAFHVPEPDLLGTRPFPDVLILTYSKMQGWVRGADLQSVFRSVIYDEIQELRRGGASMKGVAAGELSVLPYRLGLSATPIYNYGSEIFNIIDILSPGRLGNKAEFLREWCVAYGQHYRVRDPAALGAWLRDEGLMIRRTRAEVGRELPPLNLVPVVIDADMKALDAVSSSVAELARLLLSDKTSPFERGRAAREMDWRLRQATGIAKAPFVAQFVDMLFEDGSEKVVLCGWHRAVYDIWLDKLSKYNPVLYTGTESPAGKERALQAFLSGESKVLILSLRSGSGLDGLQYTGCLDIVHGELDWSPKPHDQATGRIHRDGQDESTTSWFPHCLSGSDPVIMERLAIKRQQSAGILDPQGTDAESVPDPRRMIEMARRVLKQNGG